jgi:RNA polymerase sigma-70 factor, ECF subfamily
MSVMTGETGEAEGTGDVTNATARELREPRVDELYSLAYDELKRLAGAVRHGDPFATVTTTALVNEAWLKLSAGSSHRFSDEQHFKHIVVRAMRQVLVDSARRRRALKREGVQVPFDESIPLPVGAEEHVLAIDAALTRLAVLSPRQAQMVEARFFGGFDVAETARLLNVSEATIQRDWRLARAWLAIELTETR